MDIDLVKLRLRAFMHREGILVDITMFLHLGLDILAELLKFVHVRRLSRPVDAKALDLVRLGNLYKKKG